MVNWNFDVLILEYKKGKEKRGRKENAKSTQWKKSIRKICRNHGREHTYANALKEIETKTFTSFIAIDLRTTSGKNFFCLNIDVFVRRAYI